MKSFLSAITLIAVMMFSMCGEPIIEDLVIDDTKYVCITVDDAPYFPEETEDLLDILQDYNVEATFFCVGEALLNEPELASRIAQEHVMANHTYSHINLGDLEDTSKYDNHFIAELNLQVYGTQEIIDSINLSVDRPLNKYFRPPYGSLNELGKIVLTDWVRLTWWNISAGDWDPNIEPGYIFDHTMEYVYKSEIPIILFHLGDNTEAGLVKVLDEFNRKGIKVISLDERNDLLYK